MRVLLGILAGFLCAWIGTASAALIESGIYFNPSEGGRGYSIEQQGTQMTLIIYVYETGSLAPVWYYATGGYSLNGSGYPTFSANLTKYSGGQCLGCAMTSPAGTSAGTATLTFSTASRATLSLGSSGPFGSGGSAMIPLSRYTFSDSQNPLLGQWAFAYSIGSPTYSSSYGGIVRCSTVGSPVNSGGTGFVSCAPSGYAGECYTSGSFAGQCLLIYVGSTITETYLISMPTNEFRGQYWLTPGSGTRYRVQGVRAAIAGEANLFGAGSAADIVANAAPGSVETAKLAADALASAGADAVPADPALTDAVTALAARLRGN